MQKKNSIVFCIFVIQIMRLIVNLGIWNTNYKIFSCAPLKYKIQKQLSSDINIKYHWNIKYKKIIYK